MTRIVPMILTILLVSLCLSACKDEAPQDHGSVKGHSHAEKGANGGELLELGSTGHAEIVHDEETGTIKVWLTGPDAKTPLDSRTNPSVKFVLDEKPMVVALESTSKKLPASAFVGSHEAFKNDHLHFQLGVAVNDKHYDVEPSHDHDH